MQVRSVNAGFSDVLIILPTPIGCFTQYSDMLAYSGIDPLHSSRRNGHDR